MLQVADEEVTGSIERHPQTEAAGRSDFFDRRPVGIQPEDLTPLAAAPHAAVLGDRDALGVVELRIGQGPVEENADPIVLQ